ncbi:MAG: thioredoxin [Bacteroidota bacterium]
MNSVDTTSSFQDLIRSGKPVLVDFYATWCGPCKMMGPVLSQVKQQMEDRIHILKIDVDRNPQAAAAFGIQGVPTLILFKDGSIKWRQSGVVQANELIGILNNHS